MRSVILRNRPKNIRIHLAVSRVRFHLLRFNSSGNFCDGCDLLRRNSLAQVVGRDIAEAVLALGDRLLATARDPHRLNDLVERYGEQVHTAPLDVADEAAAKAAVEKAVESSDGWMLSSIMQVTEMLRLLSS
jgi:hypothetical protein